MRKVEFFKNEDIYVKRNGELVEVKVKTSLYEFGEGEYPIAERHECKTVNDETIIVEGHPFYTKLGEGIEFEEREILERWMYYVEDGVVESYSPFEKPCTLLVERGYNHPCYFEEKFHYTVMDEHKCYESLDELYNYEEIVSVDLDGTRHVTGGEAKLIQLTQEQKEIVDKLGELYKEAVDAGVVFVTNEWNEDIRCFNGNDVLYEDFNDDDKEECEEIAEGNWKIMTSGMMQKAFQVRCLGYIDEDYTRQMYMKRKD